MHKPHDSGLPDRAEIERLRDAAYAQAPRLRAAAFDAAWRWIACQLRLGDLARRIVSRRASNTRPGPYPVHPNPLEREPWRT